ELNAIVQLEERPRRTVAAAVTFDTDRGPGAEAEYEHRNLAGNGERLNLSAGANLEVQFAEARVLLPQFQRRPGQNFITGLRLERIEDDAFSAVGATASAGIEREITDSWTIGYGGLVEFANIESSTSDGNFVLAGIPVFAAYDSSDDLLDPTEGGRARIGVTPFAGVGGGETPIFLVLDAQGSAYYDLTGEGRYILAGRGRLGSILSGELEDVPSTRRLFSGGGGSVRGYQERFIGPLDAANDPTGGRSVVEAGAELRAYVYGDLGFAVFAEGGAVSEGIVPSLDDGFQAAIGAGFRYRSPVGPLRLDVGVPVNPRDVDERFIVYLSLGQAF
ncbi:MAG: BamA/TamA family outer membrane protein, partial [Pseudomonadota bacterium]